MNLHALRHVLLRHACIPISPHPRIYYPIKVRVLRHSHNPTVSFASNRLRPRLSLATFVGHASVLAKCHRHFSLLRHACLPIPPPRHFLICERAPRDGVPEEFILWGIETRVYQFHHIPIRITKLLTSDIVALLPVYSTLRQKCFPVCGRKRRTGLHEP